MFAAWGWRFGRPGPPTLAGLVGGLLAAVVLGVALDAAVPALPTIAAGFLATNADRLVAALRDR
jgi:uncharacterized membrane protein